MRYTGPKNKIARRENMDLGFKTSGSKAQASLLRKINILPGQHGAKGRRKVSERGRQLREKQKLKFLFGLSERQLSNYFAKAITQKGNTGENLVRLLERRLDNVVYRLGFAPTRAAARQMVNHKHIKVNDKVTSIASYQVTMNDGISFAKESTSKIPVIEQTLAREDIFVPEWLQSDKGNGKVMTDPTTEEIEKQINLRLVIEYYSK